MTSLLRLSKAADLLGVTTQTLRVWDAAGKLTMVRTIGGHRRVPVAEVLRLLHEGGVETSVAVGWISDGGPLPENWEHRKRLNDTSLKKVGDKWDIEE